MVAAVLERESEKERERETERQKKTGKWRLIEREIEKKTLRTLANENTNE